MQVSKEERLLLPYRRADGGLPLHIASLDHTITSPKQLDSLLQQHRSVCPSVGGWLSVCLSVCLACHLVHKCYSVWLSVSPSTCLYVHVYLLVCDLSRIIVGMYANAYLTVYVWGEECVLQQPHVTACCRPALESCACKPDHARIHSLSGNGPMHNAMPTRCKHVEGCWRHS